MSCAAFLLVALVSSDAAEGSRVRVSTPDAGKVTGRVETISADALHIRLDEEPRSLTIPFSKVTKLEVSRGPRSRGRAAWSKAKWGALIGAVPGAISLGLQHEQVGEDGSSVAEAAALGAWSGGLFGGLIGAVIGARNPGEEWERITPAFQLGTPSGDSGFALSISIAF